MRIGQEIKFKEDFMVITALKQEELQVKEGDRALVTNMGLKILTGEARGKITNFADNTELKGYDHENISKLIYKRLCSSFEIGDFLNDNDIEANKMIEEIEDILSDIL